MQHRDLEVLTVSNGAASRSRGLDCEQWCMHQDLEALAVSNGTPVTFQLLLLSFYYFELTSCQCISV